MGRDIWAGQQAPLTERAFSCLHACGRDQVKLATEEVRALTDVELIVFAGNELHYLLADTKIASRVGHLMLVGPSLHLILGGTAGRRREWW